MIRKLALKTLLGILFMPSAWAQNPVQNPVQNTVAPAAVTADIKLRNPQDPAVAAAPAAPTVLSFMEWKAQRVQEAQQKVEQMNKTQGATQVFQEGKTALEEKVGADEQKLNFNVDVALQLNVQDYFSMYLKNLSGEEFKEATKKMSTEEVSELLLAYKNAQEKEKKVGLKFSKVPKDNAKGRKSDI